MWLGAAETAVAAVLVLGLGATAFWGAHRYLVAAPALVAAALLVLPPVGGSDARRLESRYLDTLSLLDATAERLASELAGSSRVDAADAFRLLEDAGPGDRRADLSVLLFDDRGRIYAWRSGAAAHPRSAASDTGIRVPIDLHGRDSLFRRAAARGGGPRARRRVVLHSGIAAFERPRR